MWAPFIIPKVKTSADMNAKTNDLCQVLNYVNR
jgi:hypothetical protein